MNVEILADLSSFMQDMISRGDYRDENELLIAGLHLLQARERLHSDVNAGIDQLEAGQVVAGADVFARPQQRFADF